MQFLPDPPRLAPDLRKLVFGEWEKRRLMDMQRSGAVEANAGGASGEAISAKMGNWVDENKPLQKTYMPVNLAAVRSADASRRKGRKLLRQEQIQKVETLRKTRVETFQGAVANPLK